MVCSANDLQDSTYGEWRSVYVLTGELLETVSDLGLETPVPWIIGECASSCLFVLANPLHKVYAKVNRFLQKGPSWALEKIPSYWIDRIIHNEPEMDTGYFDELDWLLSIFVKALRSKVVSCSHGNLWTTLPNLWLRIWSFTDAQMSLSGSSRYINLRV